MLPAMRVVPSVRHLQKIVDIAESDHVRRSEHSRSNKSGVRGDHGRGGADRRRSSGCRARADDWQGRLYGMRNPGAFRPHSFWNKVVTTISESKYPPV